MSAVALRKNVEPGLIKVLLVDDHELYLSGLELILDAQESIEVIGAVGSLKDGLDLLRRESPDVVLLDLRSDGTTGLDFLEQALAENPEVGVIFLTDPGAAPQFVSLCFSLGCRGILSRSIGPKELVDALERVGRGDVTISPSLAVALAQWNTTPSVESSRPLSSRELQVLRGLAEGQSNQAIAEELGLQETTVKTLLRRMYRKLGTSDRAGAVAAGFHIGVLKPRNPVELHERPTG